MKKSLESSEWILSVSLVLILASLFIISRCHEHRKKSQLIAVADAIEHPVDIRISGEVLRPGLYPALPGTRIGDLIKKSRPKRFADLRGIDLDRPIDKSMDISIPLLSEIAIRIEGAVIEPLDLKMLPGSRICDLKSKIQCERDADLRYLKRRRLLKDGEIVIIPRKELPAALP